VTALLLLLLSATPVLEAEIDSQTREDDELPPSSVTPYTPRFEGKTLAGLVCGPEVKNGSVKKLLQDGTKLTDSKDLAEVKRAVPKLQRALEIDPKAGWAYLILGSATRSSGTPRPAPRPTRRTCCPAARTPTPTGCSGFSPTTGEPRAERPTPRPVAESIFGLARGEEPRPTRCWCSRR